MGAGLRRRDGPCPDTRKCRSRPERAESRRDSGTGAWSLTGAAPARPGAGAAPELRGRSGPLGPGSPVAAAALEPRGTPGRGRSRRRALPWPGPAHLGAELVEVLHVPAHRLRHRLAGEVEQPHGGRGSARPARRRRLSLSIGGRTFRTAAVPGSGPAEGSGAPPARRPLLGPAVAQPGWPLGPCSGAGGAAGGRRDGGQRPVAHPGLTAVLASLGEQLLFAGRFGTAPCFPGQNELVEPKLELLYTRVFVPMSVYSSFHHGLHPRDAQPHV